MARLRTQDLPLSRRICSFPIGYHAYGHLFSRRSHIVTMRRVESGIAFHTAHVTFCRKTELLQFFTKSGTYVQYIGRLQATGL